MDKLNYATILNLTISISTLFILFTLYMYAEVKEEALRFFKIGISRNEPRVSSVLAFIGYISGIFCVVFYFQENLKKWGLNPIILLIIFIIIFIGNGILYSKKERLIKNQISKDSKEITNLGYLTKKIINAAKNIPILFYILAGTFQGIITGTLLNFNSSSFTLYSNYENYKFTMLLEFIYFILLYIITVNFVAMLKTISEIIDNKNVEIFCYNAVGRYKGKIIANLNDFVVFKEQNTGDVIYINKSKVDKIKPIFE